jgi:hypothetical protein
LFCSRFLPVRRVLSRWPPLPARLAPQPQCDMPTPSALFVFLSLQDRSGPNVENAETSPTHAITYPTLGLKTTVARGSAGQRVDDTLPLRTLSTLCIQHTSAAMGKATSCPQHSSASASSTSQWPCSATQQAGGKPRQSNATGGKERSAEQDQLVQRDQQRQEPEVLLRRQPFGRSS